jgi:hypothetical protein
MAQDLPCGTVEKHVRSVGPGVDFAGEPNWSQCPRRVDEHDPVRSQPCQEVVDLASDFIPIVGSGEVGGEVCDVVIFWWPATAHVHDPCREGDGPGQRQAQPARRTGDDHESAHIVGVGGVAFRHVVARRAVRPSPASGVLGVRESSFVGVREDLHQLARRDSSLDLVPGLDGEQIAMSFDEFGSQVG